MQQRVWIALIEDDEGFNEAIAMLLQFTGYEVKAYRDGLQIFQAEYQIIRADNQEIRLINTNRRIIAQKAGRSSRMIGVMYDVTPRKLLEKQKDDFISLASHELKTPVAALKATSELLEGNLHAELLAICRS